MKGRAAKERGYSYLIESTGFATANRIDRGPVVSIAIARAIHPERMKTPGPMTVRQGAS